MRISVLLAAGCFGVWAQACAQTDATESTAQALETAQGDVVAAQDSLDASREAARVCFDAFRTCKEAEGADIKACKDTLRACLPADAPKPRKCGGGGGGEHEHARCDGGPPPPPPGDGSARPEPPPAPSGAPSGPPPGDRPRHGDGDGRGPGGKECGKPPVREGGVKKCRDQAGSALDAKGTEDTSTTDATAEAHDSCVTEIFKVDAIGPACDRALALCSQSDAPADVCVTVRTSCAVQ